MLYYIMELPLAVHIEEIYMYKSSTCISYLNADTTERSSSFSASSLVQNARAFPKKYLENPHFGWRAGKTDGHQ